MSDLDIGKIVHELRINCQHNEANLIEQQQREIEELKSKLDSEQKSIWSLVGENTALAAHVERFKPIMQELNKAREARIHNDEWSAQQFISKAVSDSGFIKQSPQTSLAEHDAEVAYYSYIKGACDFGGDAVIGHAAILDESADQHANKIRNGES